MRKVMKEKVRRIVAMLLIWSIMWSSFHLQMIQVHAENSASILYEYEGYQVQYTVINAWEGGQQVEIAIRNTGTEIIRDWEMMFDTQGKITNIWNAVIQTETDKKYFVKNEPESFTAPHSNPQTICSHARIYHCFAAIVCGCVEGEFYSPNV